MILPREYIVNKFYELGSRPKYNKYNKTYQCSCPICREGKSPFKRRCYYIPEKDLIYCHNCGWSSKPLKWISEVSGKSESEILSDVRSNTYDISNLEDEDTPVRESPTLPENSINLYDATQTEFYKGDAIVQSALDYIKQRRLDTAVNRPRKLFLSLTDIIHKNRIIIPFYDRLNNIVHYQSRKFLQATTGPKYLSKIGQKTLFNINNIDESYDKLFIFEGPIDSFFTKNGIAVAGITEKSEKSLTDIQYKQLQQFMLHEHIWVLDSQWQDKASLSKTEVLLDKNESVFIWPWELGYKIKDFNDLAMLTQRDEVPTQLILDNTFNGIEGQVKLAEIKRNLSNW